MRIQKSAIIVLFFAIGFSVKGQTLAQLIKAGDENFAAADYYAASVYYNDAVKKDEENPELNFKLAESRRMFNDYEGAATAYRAVTKYDKTNKFPLATFWLAEMLRGNCTCKTEEAQKLLKKFKGRYRTHDFYLVKADQEMQACSWVIDHPQKMDSINIQHLGREVNSESSEFNPIFVYPDRLQFSSLRNVSHEKKHDKYLVRIYNQQPNPEKIYMPAGADSALNVGNGFYTPDLSRFYFTQCEQVDKVSNRCDIYESKYDKYKWQPAEKLSINDASATSTQPTIGYDDIGNEYLFFSSNRKDGQGGMDLWQSRINADGTYGTPVNLPGKINTKGNEVTPFFDLNSHQLFFSSDWLYGYGGYDVFVTKLTQGAWADPKNLMQPVNTPQNDLYYTVAYDNSKVFLTSNRKGSYFVEAETCCNDIYAYKTGKKTDWLRDSLTIAHKINRDTVSSTKLDSSNLTGSGTATITKDTATVTTAKQTTAANGGAGNQPPHFIDEQLKKVKQLLPVTLYFHNDEPDCCNLRDTTNLTYAQTYESYSAQLSEYRRQFTAGLKGSDKSAAEQQVFDLFTQKVDKGFYELVAFTSQLLDLLNAGNHIEVTVKGYCSPLNYNIYNIKLGYRRVASLRNYFFHYRNGILLPFIKSGALVLKSESLGEETAPKTVSDKLEDTRNSVYNPAAAVERRVEIVSVELK